jgi:benzoate-CoA ligase family protein
MTVTYNAAVALLSGKDGARVAYVDETRSITYAELEERANRAGNLLRALGVQREQRVLLVMHDTIDFPAMFLGAIKAGIVPVPINTLLAPKDYAFMIDDSRARAMIVSDALAEKVGAPIDVRVVRTSELEALLEAQSSQLEAARTHADEIAFWLYSSGSTGTPKGAMHLHASIEKTVELYAKGTLGIRKDDVVFSAAKLFFAYGLGNALTFPLSIGATTILASERVTPALVARVMEKHAPTIFCGVPTLFASLLADPTFVVSKKLRVSISAGEALPKHVGQAWRDRFGSDILDGIGSTELLHIFLSNRHGDVKYGTSGKPVHGYTLEIRGDDGAPCGDGEEGVLWVRGTTACAGYWNNREKSLETFHGAWTRTGDRYVRDEDGYFTYSGRADDMLKVSGIWVSPFEVESALASHEAVLEAAVVGHADADELVKPKAFVVLKDAAREGAELEAELKTWVKSKLAPYKYPRWIEFVRELPKTATGKIQRFKLRA